MGATTRLGCGVQEARHSLGDKVVWPDGRPFLTAEWRHLAMLNFPVDPVLLKPFVPAGTEIDFFDGRTYVSMVGFLFQRTCIWGLSIPSHANFEEVNLRFYVRRRTRHGWRRGVVFVRELVPRLAVALVANLCYGENYSAVPMSHCLDLSASDDSHARPNSVRYEWEFAHSAYAIEMSLSGSPAPLADGSLDEFIAEHYWGYAARRNGGATEYQVAHPAWRVCPADQCSFSGNVSALYGPELASTLSAEPASAFWADGSAVRVYRGRRILGAAS